MIVNTVGELKALLEKYPDSMALSINDDDVGYGVGVEVSESISLGLFDMGGNLRYYTRKPLWGIPEWVRDEEVLVLG